MSLHQSARSAGNHDVEQRCRLAQPARGVIVPIVSPLSSRDELDVAGLERLTEHVIRGGVHGIFLLGTTGEASALSVRLRRELITRVCRYVGGRVPVLVGVSDTSLVESLRLAEHAADAGAAATVVTTPYYLSLETAELVKFVEEVNDESPLPVFLYNMPELTKTWFSIEVLSQLLDLQNIVGLKDSSGDTAYFAAVQELFAQRPDWSLLVGSDFLMGWAVRNGAHGSVSGGANIWPELFTRMYDAATVGDDEAIAGLQQQIVELGNIYQYGGYGVGSIRGIKSALKSLAISDDRMASPFMQVSEAEREAIAAQLRRLGLLMGSSDDGFANAQIDQPAKSARVYGSPVSTAR